MVALTLADAALEKFGGDSLVETVANYRSHQERIERLIKERDPVEKS